MMQSDAIGMLTNEAPHEPPAKWCQVDASLTKLFDCRENSNVALELLGAGAPSASRHCVFFSFDPSRRSQRRLGERRVGLQQGVCKKWQQDFIHAGRGDRSEEHTSELQ